MQLAGGTENDSAKGGMFDEYLEPLSEDEITNYYRDRSNLILLNPANSILQTSVQSPDWVPSADDANAMSDALGQQREDIAFDIANGHGYQDRSNQFLSQLQYESSVIETLTINTESGIMPNGRSFYYSSGSGMIVIVDPYSEDYGTAFFPRDWAEYRKTLR